MERDAVIAAESQRGRPTLLPLLLACIAAVISLHLGQMFGWRVGGMPVLGAIVYLSPVILIVLLWFLRNLMFEYFA